MNKFEGITVFAPSEPEELHDAVIALFSRKTGTPVYNCHLHRHQWLEASSSISANQNKRVGHREISLRELSEMPDYSEPAKEMTVSEISKELGYEVKIVK